MSLRLLGHIPLPGHSREGRLDHAAVHGPSSRLYLAHTSNDALDVIDCASDKYLRSLPDLREVAGVLVSEERRMVFTSNRGENTVSIMPLGREGAGAKVPVGSRPNGLAFDPGRGILLAANVGEARGPASSTVSLVDVTGRSRMKDITVPGRTRWAIYDPRGDTFYVNIVEPPQVVAIEAEDTTKTWSLEIPVQGPHGLDLDPKGRRLFCACDEGKLVVVDLDARKVSIAGNLSGKPDVVFFNQNLAHLYVALKEPGAIDVFDTNALARLETVATEAGAGTMALDSRRDKVYAFLPRTSRVAVYRDGHT